MEIDDYRLVGLHVTDRCLEVPLDWMHPDDGRTISVFFREVCGPAQKEAQLPLLVFLQGGPGGKSPRPTSSGPGWLLDAVKKYRVILPDQRGTGRSSRITGATMNAMKDAQAAADYLAHFDAHAIVADLEHIRKNAYQGACWETLGQSYGGFLTLSYLSHAPEGLVKCYIAGGLPSLSPNPDEVYQRTYAQVAKKMRAYYARFPQDAQKLNAIADYIQVHQPRLPNGDVLTVRRFQSLGLMIGMGNGAERLHWLIEEAFVDERQSALNHHFLLEVMVLTGFDENPLFAALHENIYASPNAHGAWAAERERQQHPEFAEDHRPLYLTGEMIYPWMFEEISVLRPFKEAVEVLAHKPLPRPFYDPARLANNSVPVAAVIYFDDMYVDVELSLQTAEAVENLTYWLTNEFEHDGLRQDSKVFEKLQSLVQDR
ncbi:alpha/beta hydrolase family protein [Halomonas sp. M20]|uniref:alpha/beta hydrolase family protein n=1 Tax=Halomonas sp. M20 TaxID=2763264 RepID=UPI001D0ADAB2|nr:alpha/beta fold hydrolase [Halomonas sp. M20]